MKPKKPNTKFMTATTICTIYETREQYLCQLMDLQLLNMICQIKSTYRTYLSILNLFYEIKISVSASFSLTPKVFWVSVSFPFISSDTKYSGLQNRETRIWHSPGHLLFGFEVIVMTVIPSTWDTVRGMMQTEVILLPAHNKRNK